MIRYYLIPTKIGIIKKTKNIMLVRMWRKGSFTLLVQMQKRVLTLRTVWKFTKKLHIGLPHSKSAFNLVYTHKRIANISLHKLEHECSWAVFITAKSPSTDKLIYKIQYNSHNGMLFEHTKENEEYTTWMNLEAL